MRINEMITRGKCSDLLSYSLNSFFKELYGDQFGEFVRGYWDLVAFNISSHKSPVAQW